MSRAAPEAAERPRETLAADYVLGLLEPAAAAAAEALLARDRGFAAEVGFWRERFAALDAAAPALPPSPGLWERIEEAIAAEAILATKPRRRAADPRPVLVRLWESLALWRGGALAGAAASIVLGLLLGTGTLPVRQAPTLVAVLLTPEQQPGALVQAFADGTVQLIPITSIAVPEGRALEVWTLPSRERGPVSIGLLDRPRTVRLRLEDLPRPGRDQLFEITLEPATGSPIGRPTGPILMKGLTAETL